jgi:hypothetical protein
MTGCVCVARFVCVCARCERRPDDRVAACDTPGHAHETTHTHVAEFSRPPVWTMSPIDSVEWYVFRSHHEEVARA